VNSCHNIFWECNATLSVSVNFSWEFTNFVVELALLVKIVDELLNTKREFSAINTIINGFHDINCLIKVFCGTSNSSNSGLNWYSLFKANSSGSSNDWLRILTNVLRNFYDIIENNFCFIPELFPETLAIFLSHRKFVSDCHDGLVAAVNSSCISVPETTQNVIFNLSHLWSFEGGRDTCWFLWCRSILVSWHHTVARLACLLTDISVIAPNIAVSCAGHLLAAFLWEPVSAARRVRGAAFAVSKHWSLLGCCSTSN